MRSLILLGMLVLSQVSHAALFDDEGARKKIIELQQQIDTQNQATQKSLRALEQRITAIEAIVKGQGLTDLLGQIESLNKELSKVKGDLEIATHNIEATQQRQKDLYGDTDGRLRKLEGGTPVASGADASAPATAGVAVANADGGAQAKEAEATKDFEAAQALSKAGKHREAFDAYEKFLQTYPTSSRVPEAQYALGYSQFSLKNYKASIATQQKLLQQYPDTPKAPDAMFNIANSQIQLADIEGAKKTLRGLLSQYPNSDVAPNAKKRLTVLDSFKSK
jgi:tol-pal system protein YbgF